MGRGIWYFSRSALDFRCEMETSCGGIFGQRQSNLAWTQRRLLGVRSELLVQHGLSKREQTPRTYRDTCATPAFQQLWISMLNMCPRVRGGRSREWRTWWNHADRRQQSTKGFGT